DEIGDGEVGFVADAGDYGNLRIGNRAGDDFFVEGPQVFEGASPAGENQHVHELFCIEELQRFDDFLRGAFALHAHGKHGEIDVGKTAREDAHDVADGSTARRSDEADTAGKQRQRLLARRIEETFPFEALFQLVEGELKRAEADRLDFLDVNLIFAALFVDADGATHGDLQAVFGAELDAALLLFEENAFNLRAVVFQGEIDVAGLRFAAVGDFALDEDVGEIAGEEIADASGELADGQDLASGLKVEGELAHGSNK